MEGTTFGGVPLNVELKLEVWDSPNSAGIVIDAVRCAKLALDRGIGGALDRPVELLHEVAAAAVHRRTRRGSARIRFIDGDDETARTELRAVTTTFFLVRHAAHDRVGRVLCGRMPGVQPRRGRAARRRGALAERLARERDRGRPVEPARAGARDGGADRRAARLEPSRCTRRSTRSISATGRARPSTELERRSALGALERRPRRQPPARRRDHAGGAGARRRPSWRRCATPTPDGRVVLVSHADVIKAALLYLPRPAARRLPAASRSARPRSATLVVGDWGAKVLSHERGGRRMKIVVFGLTISLLLGQRPRDPLAGPVPGAGARAATASCSSSRTCPITPRNRDLLEVPGGELVLYARLGRRAPARGRRELARRRRGDGHLLLPATGSRRPSSCSTRRAPLRVFYDLDTPVTLSRLQPRRGDHLYRPARPRRFRPRAQLHRRARPSTRCGPISARAAWRRSTAMSIPDVHRPVAPHAALSLPTSPISAPTRRTGRRRWRRSSSSRRGGGRSGAS